MLYLLLCLLVNLLLKPHINKINTIIKDSQELLQKSEYHSINTETLFLYSCDFESLYTNIVKEEAVSTITDFIKDSLDYQFITPRAFFTILNLIFDNNVFKYKNFYFIQLNGVAMGCICGPDIANLYVYILEKHWIQIERPLFYYRYIDDIFIASKNQLNIVNFTSNFRNLKLNIIQDNIVNFLDLNISFNSLIGKLVFSLYIKPTNTFQ